MSADIEDLLRTELARRADSTPVSPTALADIRRRAGRRHGPRRVLRPAVALVAAIALLVLAVAIVQRGGPGIVEPPAVRPLPVRPPALDGTVFGDYSTVPCLADCGPGRLELSDLGYLMATAGRPLRDGRELRPNPDDGSWYAQAGGRHGVRVTGSFPLSVDVTTDGRVATFARPTPRGEPAELRLAGGASGQETVVLPDGFVPRALAAGPDRWVALLGDLAACCPSADHPALVLVPPRGEPRVVDAGEALPGGIPTAPGRPMLTWGATGLVAVSTDTLPRTGGSTSPPAVRTVVLDPTTGRLAAEIDGWAALAWSPDGTGLLGARRTGARAGELRVFWGPGLARHTDVGPTSVAFTPYWWVDDLPPITPADPAGGPGR